MTRTTLAAVTTALLSTVSGGPALAAITVLSDPVLFWNQTAMPLSGGGLAQIRALAMANIAMHDAVNHTQGSPRTPYLTGVVAPGGNRKAAAAQAAHDVLVALFPANAAAYATALADSLAQVPDGAKKADGVATGAAYAAAILAARTGDVPPPVAYVPTGLPGDWRPTPPAFAPAATPQWADATPFLMASSDALRPAAPPALDSAAYAAAYAEVAEIGALASATRTAAQTDSALFWGPATANVWMRFALVVAEDEALSTLDFSQLFARLAISQIDGLIAGWDAKYEYRLWRPVTAITEGDADGNPATVGDPAWLPLSSTPPHPSYVSTAAIIGTAASAILLDAIGDEAFCGMVGAESRCWSGLGEAANDSADSRLWSGIHYRFDMDAGRAMGGAVAGLVLDDPRFDVPGPGAVALLGLGVGVLAAVRKRRA